jgi:hypothetical protein
MIRRIFESERHGTRVKWGTLHEKWYPYLKFYYNFLVLLFRHRLLFVERCCRVVRTLLHIRESTGSILKTHRPDVLSFPFVLPPEKWWHSIHRPRLMLSCVPYTLVRAIRCCKTRVITRAL